VPRGKQSTRVAQLLLQGKQVAFTGRLASMTRVEAARLVAAHGGEVTATVSGDFSLLVVGRDGWPLAKDGRLTRKLRKARWLARQGRDVTIMPEEELLARLHIEPLGRLSQRYTTGELTNLLGLSRDRLRTWMRAGLIQPVDSIDGIGYFDFCQVAGAKNLSDLTRAGVSTARLRQSLSQLQSWLGDAEHPLAQLTILERSGRLLVRLENGLLAEPTGQLHFDFSAQPQISALSLPARTESPETLFDRGYAAEEAGDFAEAAHAYREALLAGGPEAEGCFNLANVLYALGQKAQAGERFRQAVELNPTFCEAWNNLGTVLCELSEPDEALRAYRKALQLDPLCSDAHYNLADMLDGLGRHLEARPHWQSYLRQDPTGPWAEHARARLKG